MLKKILFSGLSFLILIQSNAQIENNSALQKTINSAIVYQALNDFDHNIPVAVLVPGFFFAGAFKYNSNPKFNENDFYQDFETVNTSDRYQSIIYEVISKPFIRYIPSDSAMSARFIDGSRLTFELGFSKSGDTILFTQSDPKKTKTKTIKFLNGDMVSVLFKDEKKKRHYSSQLYGDSIRIADMRESVPDDNYRKVIRYKSGILNEISDYSVSGLSFILESREVYIFNEQNKPSLKLRMNKKGKITDSVKYFYHDDLVTLTQYFNQGQLKRSVSNHYNETGRIDERVFDTYLGREVISYFYPAENIIETIFSPGSDIPKNKFILKFDINQRLADMENLRIKEEYGNAKLKSRWISDYNDKGNLSNITILNSKGSISRIIKIEYSYFNP